MATTKASTETLVARDSLSVGQVTLRNSARES